ncbi:MAG: type II secretion system F family protein [Blautia sp.]|nr:type II secretion system F family protein [Blautia sp.]
MWIHIVIFAILLILWAGWKSGWIPAADFMDKEGKKLFFLLAVSGNILGLFLSLQSLDRTLPEGNRLIRTEDSYDQELMVSVDGKEQSRITVEIPGRIDVEEEDEQKQISEEEEERLQLLEMLERYNTEKGDEDYFWLPENWEGKNYEWQRPRDTKGSLLAALFLAAAAATLVLKGRESFALEQKRQDQLLLDYPELIMKFTLFVQAGMTVRNTFGKMASDYSRKKPAGGRYAYEELTMAVHEMDSGISESEAYYRFGERCGQVRYKTFSTLLVQNLQKGSRQLSQMLEAESLEAWDERKRKARIVGEEAATKLLFPMILMMGVVMAIVMIPAMISF